ncbi:MAG: hypothetical protein HFG66_15480 [Hungatella sp.]|nr:hypothetical protein [Hungatella sp.]
MTTRTKGTANKKVIPKAANFLSFPSRLKRAAIIHRNIIAAAATAEPMENTSLTWMNRPNKNRYGKIKKLNDRRLAIIPFFPRIIPGKNMTHAKMMELTGMGDHVNLPDIAISQIRHTTIPVKRVTENTIEIITFFILLCSSFLFKAIRFSSAFFS